MKKKNLQGLNVNLSQTVQLNTAYPFPSSSSESELSEEEDEEEEEEEEDDDEEEELGLLLLLLFPFLLALASFPFKALSRLTVCSDGGAAVTGDSFLPGPRDSWLVSGWLPARDLLEVTSVCLDSECEPLLSKGGACDESLEGPCDDEERLFWSLSSLLSSPRSVLLSLSVGALESFLSAGGEGEAEEEEEEELEEDDEEEEDLWDWGMTFGGGCSFSFCLSCSTSLCRTLSRSLSLTLSLERERLLLLLCWGEGERRDLEEEKNDSQFSH